MWPSKTMLTGVPAFAYFSFLLRFINIRVDEREMFGRFARIGIEAGRPFDLEQSTNEIQRAITEGALAAHHRIKHRCQNLGPRVNGWTIVPRIRGNRDLLSGSPEKLFTRAVQAMFGIYGVDLEECVYLPAEYDASGDVLDGSKHNYIFHLREPPPCRGFWSLTVYDGDTQFLVRNAIGDRTKGLKYGEDGSLTLYLQHEAPVEEHRCNWLPAPAARLFVMLRMYIPEQDAIDARYVPPAIEKQCFDPCISAISVG